MGSETVLVFLYTTDTELYWKSALQSQLYMVSRRAKSIVTADYKENAYTVWTYVVKIGLGSILFSFPIWLAVWRTSGHSSVIDYNVRQ